MVIQAIELIVAGGGLFQGIFVTIFLLVRKPAQRADRSLAFLMLVCSLNVAHPLLSFFIPDSSPGADLDLIEPMEYLIPPLIAMYYRTLILPSFRFRLCHILHGIPLAASVIGALSPLLKQLDRIGPRPWASILMWMFLFIQFVAYIVPSIDLLHRYRRSLRDTLSNTFHVDLGWLTWISHIFIALTVLYFFLLILIIASPFFPPVRYILVFTLASVVWILGYRQLLGNNVKVSAAALPPATERKKFSYEPERCVQNLPESCRAI